MAYELDREVRAELRSLAKPVAETVARRLVASGELLDVDPELSLGHAVAARRAASRIAAVREAVGLAAYRCEQWQLALSELRAYHRMTGRQTHLAILADCERGLGRPARAVDMLRATDRRALDPADWVELLIVAAGARRDMGQTAASVTMLQIQALKGTGPEPWRARLRYAYADALAADGRHDEARRWFGRAAALDTRGETDAAERLLEMEGVVLDEAEDEDDTDTLSGDQHEHRDQDAHSTRPDAEPEPDDAVAADAGTRGERQGAAVRREDAAGPDADLSGGALGGEVPGGGAAGPDADVSADGSGVAARRDGDVGPPADTDGAAAGVGPRDADDAGAEAQGGRRDAETPHDERHAGRDGGVA